MAIRRLICFLVGHRFGRTGYVSALGMPLRETLECMRCYEQRTGGLI